MGAETLMTMARTTMKMKREGRTCALRRAVDIGGGSESAGADDEGEMKMMCRIRLVLALPECFPGKGLCVLSVSSG